MFQAIQLNFDQFLQTNAFPFQPKAHRRKFRIPHSVFRIPYSAFCIPSSANLGL